MSSIVDRLDDLAATVRHEVIDTALDGIERGIGLAQMVGEGALHVAGLLEPRFVREPRDHVQAYGREMAAIFMEELHRNDQ